MHSGYEIPGIQQQPQSAAESGAVSLTDFLEQIHTLPAAQQPHFLPPETRLSHHYVGPELPYFPVVNFKLGLNEDVCSRSNQYNDRNSIDEEVDGGDQLLHGSESYEQPTMLHCWRNQQDFSNIKHPSFTFWEHLALSEASYENVETVLKKRHKAHEPDHCVDTAHFGELLEAIYQPLGTADASRPLPQPRRKKKKNMREYGICPMAEFLGDFLRRLVERQESMHRELAEALERLEEERLAREDEWRRTVAERLQRESESRAREVALARDREAVIISYLERISGKTVGT